MLRCTWAARGWLLLRRSWAWAGSPARGSGEHGLCSGPGSRGWRGPEVVGKKGNPPPPPPPLPPRPPPPPGAALPLDAAVPQDVVLYQYERQGAFLSLGLFILGQAGFWGYLAYIAYDSKPEPAPKEPQEGDPPEKREKRPRTFPLLVGIEDAESFRKWRLGFTGACLAAGILVVSSAYLFSRRSVSRILLHRGGQAVSITTYYPFGFTSTFTVPLKQVCGASHRSQARAMIAIKVKNKLFYYLVDKQGQFPDATLFDLTVGAFRRL
ncbi:hypothetical protein JRQ81_009582 [Phrynocephalus forsythii]|uniref:Transmembrane protein 223 n=1 Tax=Phrynocephalus forsythii TaxID=171643 RepID=A0A9Q0XAK9_9SAUR|nr:hypothetical protein JRQ81_009582 [Phrynocephalus forsythii]